MPNIQTAPGFNKPAADIRNMGGNELVELKNALRNTGYFQGAVDASPAGLDLVLALGAFQRTAGLGDANPVVSTDAWYSLLHLNHLVVNRQPLDVGAWNTLVGARQMGLGGVVDPNQWAQAPAGGIGYQAPAAPPAPVPATWNPPTSPFPSGAVAGQPSPHQGQAPAVPNPTPGTGLTPPTPTPEAGTGGPVDFTNAYALIDSFLREFDLGEGSEFDLRAWAKNVLTSPDFDPVVFQAQLEQTDAYRTRFGSTNEQRRALGLPRMTPKEILEYEEYAMGVMRAAGLPSGFYDNWRDFQSPLGAGVSPAELSERVDIARSYAYRLPPEVRSQFQEWFGPGDLGAITAYVLDEERALPVIQRQLTMAEVAGAGDRFGIGISQDQAGTLADLGVTYERAQQGFSRLDQVRPVFTESVGEREDLTVEGEGVAATFGTAPGAQTQIERRLAGRQKALEGGGGAAVSSRGIIGAGRAV